MTEREERILEDEIEFEHETLTHELLMRDPTIGKTVAQLRAMTVLLQQERAQNFCRLSL